MEEPHLAHRLRQKLLAALQHTQVADSFDGCPYNSACQPSTRMSSFTTSSSASNGTVAHSAQLADDSCNAVTNTSRSAPCASDHVTSHSPAPRSSFRQQHPRANSPSDVLHSTQHTPMKHSCRSSGSSRGHCADGTNSKGQAPEFKSSQALLAELLELRSQMQQVQQGGASTPCALQPLPKQQQQQQGPVGRSEPAQSRGQQLQSLLLALQSSTADTDIRKAVAAALSKLQAQGQYEQRQQEYRVQAQGQYQEQYKEQGQQLGRQVSPPITCSNSMSNNSQVLAAAHAMLPPAAVVMPVAGSIASPWAAHQNLMNTAHVAAGLEAKHLLDQVASVVSADYASQLRHTIIRQLRAASDEAQTTGRPFDVMAELHGMLPQLRSAVATACELQSKVAALGKSHSSADACPGVIAAELPHRTGRQQPAAAAGAAAATAACTAFEVSSAPGLAAAGCIDGVDAAAASAAAAALQAALRGGTAGATLPDQQWAPLQHHQALAHGGLSHLTRWQQQQQQQQQGKGQQGPIDVRRVVAAATADTAPATSAGDRKHAAATGLNSNVWSDSDNGLAVPFSCFDGFEVEQLLQQELEAAALGVTAAAPTTMRKGPYAQLEQ